MERCGGSLPVEGERSKKKLHASEQDRPDVARRRRQRKKYQGRVDPRRDCREFRAEVGHDRSKGARQCRDAKNLAFSTPFSTSCWPVPIPRRFSTLTG